MTPARVARRRDKITGRGVCPLTLHVTVKSRDGVKRFRSIVYLLGWIGLRRTLTVVRVRISDIWFDRKFGYDTVNQVDIERLHIASKNRSHGKGYQPTGVSAFQQILDRVDLPRDVGFVDYGCGKGRILLLAAQAGFSNVVGVEWSAELCAIAESNVSRFAATMDTAPPIRVVHADAATWEPDPQVSVFYFFLPFDAHLMREVLARIVRSVTTSPRRAWVIYNVPTHRAELDRLPEFELETDLVAGGYDCLVYVHNPA